MSVAGGVFISYRREDSAGFARAIYVRLSERLGREKVFFDVNDIVSGDDFVEVLSKRVGDCDALVAIIGRDWLNSVDKSGRRRLDNAEDFVRIEIAAALTRGVRVIPVLVEDAAMPQASDLPDNLKTLARRQALEVDNKRFDFDVDQLAKVLSPNTGTGPETGALLQAPKVPAAAAVEAQPKRESPVAPNDGGASRKRVAGLVLAAIGVIALVALAFMFIPRGQLSLQKADDKGRPPLGDRTIDAAAPDAHTTGAAGGNGHAEIAGAVDFGLAGAERSRFQSRRREFGRGSHVGRESARQGPDCQGPEGTLGPGQTDDRQYVFGQ